MAEAASPAPESVANNSAPKRVLLVVIVGSHDLLHDILTGLLDIGVPGTVIEARGLMSLMREEMPIFSGLAAMLPETSGSRIVLSLTTSDLANELFGFISREIHEKHMPIAFTVPIEAVLGEHGGEPTNAQDDAPRG